MSETDFRLPKPTLKRQAEKLSRKVRFLILDRTALIEAFFLALAFHVLFFPVIWVSGWALPWPKSPVIQTIIEYDLRNWLIDGKPKSVHDVRPPELNN